MLKPEQMSTAEREFIRTYVSALRREFNLLQSVTDLMDPDLLGVTDVMTAVNVAVELQHMHAKFEATLHDIPSLHKFARKPVKSGPSIDDIANMFAMSFFKVFAVLEDTKKTHTKKKDAGWFSGQPEEWQAAFKQLEATKPESEKNQSSAFNMFSKFFPHLNLFKNFNPFQQVDDAPLNQWPPMFPGFGLTDQQKLGYDEEDYDDEEDEN